MKGLSTQVTIAEPCTQKWERMQKYDGHNFCESCQKCVIDFSGYTTTAILETLASSKTNICGRLSQTQLNQLNYSLSAPIQSRNWMKYLGVLAIGVSVFAQDVQAVPFKHEIEQRDRGQKNPSSLTSPKAIYGYLHDVKGKPLNKIKVFISNTKLSAVTDLNGRYEIKLAQPLSLRNNLLIANDVIYQGEFQLNVLKEKQDNFTLKKVDMMIMGEIRIGPRKLKV